MEWERGDTTPGRVMANLKTGGLGDLLEAMVTSAEGPGGALATAGQAVAEVPEAGGPPDGQPSSWAPAV
jgi:hypothetical protein